MQEAAGAVLHKVSELAAHAGVSFENADEPILRPGEMTSNYCTAITGHMLVNAELQQGTAAAVSGRILRLLDSCISCQFLTNIHAEKLGLLLALICLLCMCIGQDHSNIAVCEFLFPAVTCCDAPADIHYIPFAPNVVLSRHELASGSSQLLLAA
jgi:hypothetical protein